MNPQTATTDVLLRCLDAGLLRARQELELTPQEGIAEAELSVALKYALADRLAEAYGGVAELRKLAKTGELPGTLRAEALTGADALLAAARQQRHAICCPHLDRPALRARVADLAIDALLSERLAPEIILAPGSRALSPHPPIHALIFSAFPHCAHELYPLLVDALTARLADPSAPPVRVVGAHEGWLRDGALRRVLLLDAEANRLLELDLEPPVMPASAQVLALDLTRETASHAAIEAALPDTRFTNPLAGAARLDDKTWTAETWRDAGLPTPAFNIIPTDASDDDIRALFADWLAQHGPRLVIKPTDGTEGRGVTLIDFSAPEARGQSLAAVRYLLQHGPVLLMEERGLLRCGEAAAPRRFTIRINVCWDGQSAHAESGYAQVAADPHSIASAGRGGRVAPLEELWHCLRKLDGTPLHPIHEDWRRLLVTAEAGAAVLAQRLGTSMPRLVGLDLLLDPDDAGAVHPVLLEANPRPAGMSHACFVTPDGPTGEPGVTQRLWSSLA